MPAPVNAGLVPTGAAADAGGPAETVAVELPAPAVAVLAAVEAASVVRVGAGGPFGSKIPPQGSVVTAASAKLRDVLSESDAEFEALVLASFDAASEALADALAEAEIEFDTEFSESLRL